MSYPIAFIRFIKPLQYLENGEVVLPSEEHKQEYFSEYFKPNLNISVYAIEFMRRINDNRIKANSKKLPSDSFLTAIEESNIKYTNKFIYLLAQTIVLETSALDYAVNEEPYLVNYVNTKTINVPYQNLRYLLSFFSGKEEYKGITLGLQNMIIQLGTLRQQAPLIRGEMNGRL